MLTKKKQFIPSFFLLGMLLFKFDVFALVHEFGHLLAFWITGSEAVLKNWRTVEAEFLTPFSLYAGFGFEAIVLYTLSIFFIGKEISNRIGFLFWGYFHSVLIFAPYSSDFGSQAVALLGSPEKAFLGKAIWLCVTVSAAAAGWYLIIYLVKYNQSKGVAKLIRKIRRRTRSIPSNS